MRTITTTLAAAALTLASFTAGTAHAATNTVPSPSPTPPSIQMLACNGTTGSEGCGPGWYWRNGERGWACYPCNN